MSKEQFAVFRKAAVFQKPIESKPGRTATGATEDTLGLFSSVTPPCRLNYVVHHIVWEALHAQYRDEHHGACKLPTFDDDPAVCSATSGHIHLQFESNRHFLGDRGRSLDTFQTKRWVVDATTGSIAETMPSMPDQFGKPGQPPQRSAVLAWLRDKQEKGDFTYLNLAEPELVPARGAKLALLPGVANWIEADAIDNRALSAAELGWRAGQREDYRNAIDPLLHRPQYAMLVKELTIVLHAVGFDPMLGFFHRPRYGRPSLALDLAEEFRPLIGDSVVLRLINNGEVTPSSFIRRAGGVALTDAGRRAVITAFERRMDTLVTHPIFGSPGRNSSARGRHRLNQQRP